MSVQRFVGRVQNGNVGRPSITANCAPAALPSIVPLALHPAALTKPPVCSFPGLQTGPPLTTVDQLILRSSYGVVSPLYVHALLKGLQKFLKSHGIAHERWNRSPIDCLSRAKGNCSLESLGGTHVQRRRHVLVAVSRCPGHWSL
jgi:hypothetical protein